MPYVIEPMHLQDIQAVAEIERRSFTTPWPVHAYKREISENRNSRYIVARWLEPDNGRDAAYPLEQPHVQMSGAASEASGGIWQAVSRFLPFFRQEESPGAPVLHRKGTIVGYAGLWIILDEAHITTIAVRPEDRGKGIGELLLVRLIELGQQLGGQRMTLEVRLSNEVAQSLYRKYTMTGQGVRRRYYSDDGEDGLIMWSEPINEPSFQARFDELRSALRRRFGEGLEGI